MTITIKKEQLSSFQNEMIEQYLKDNEVTEELFPVFQIVVEIKEFKE